MSNRVSKPPFKRSRLKLSKCLQQELLNALASEDTVGASLSQDAPVKSAKRQLDEVDEAPIKKARLTNHQTREVEPAEQAPVLQHPKPKPPYASFLEDFVDPVHQGRADSSGSLVLGWLESVGSDRETRCRSDSHLDPSESPIPRQLARSAPEMSQTLDADGFAVPLTPASAGSRDNVSVAQSSSVTGSDTPSSARSTSRSLVEDPNYRIMNLAANNVHLRSSRTQLPDSVADLVGHMRRDRNSPGPSHDQVLQDMSLEALQMGATEADVGRYFQTNVFPAPGPEDTLQCSLRQPMVGHAVPSTAGSSHKISTPVPDMFYGYNWAQTFPQQQAQLASMGTGGLGNNQQLAYPFFVIELKGEGPSGGSKLWVATNQCLGASASCINIAERLRRSLAECQSDEIREIDTATFSIAMSGTEARLYVSWKHDALNYYMKNVKSFLLQDPDHYIEFRKYVRNIIDWGKGGRLEAICESLDILLEENRKRASAAAKARTPPDADAASSSSSRKSRKTSSRGRKSGS
ncbi:hypothetical protein ACRE_075200 [Hapsidospora chrysogenum ATCC 11550]|uniref:DUF7924 domain-containing protein n=1 Tax=Hapsidospora chrysogenum (strain ATCC 11550 / CBS 779.69 / DSM 880 / IAM 14645 / JCM 23072 / IMI 49137) TaxID=857340 RepID=A0A086SXC4_HAPC1|nr:hypothetical protein ACRE_075200 [Hapsidospora chrysogenum ATCC 11550]